MSSAGFRPQIKRLTLSPQWARSSFDIAISYYTKGTGKDSQIFGMHS